MRTRYSVAAVLLTVVVSACGATSPETTEPEAAVTSSSTIASAPATTAAATTTMADDEAVVLAESFIDAFYSWDREALENLPWSESASLDEITFYQDWAEAGNYQILNRQPCERRGPTAVDCPVTVEDDLIKALGLDFNVTDTFRLTISEGEITGVQTGSDDPELVGQAFEWVLERNPDLMEGACQGFFAGGPTPDECIRAIIAGYEEFAASEDFPGEP